jgi:glycosyltransferase involved in cell wall biosynthesis
MIRTPGTAVKAPGRRPVAYVMSRFPKLTETFILYEILAVEAAGQPVEIYPLIREREDVVHADAEPLVARAHYVPFVSPAVLASQVHFLRHRSRAYLGALWDVARETFGSRRFFFNGLAAFPKIAHVARLMESAGIAHVHCHFASHPAVAGFVIRRLTGIPYSFTAHGTDLHADHHMLCRKTAEAAFVVAISEDNRTEIVEACGPGSEGRVDVIHSGVDTTAIRPAARPAPIEGSPLRILCIGTLHEVKGQAYLVDACAALARDGVPFTLRFVGDGPDRPMLEERAGESGIADRVWFDGRLTRDQIIGQLHDADALVAPSVPTRRAREGIPVVLMEGMSAGLPVVASRLSGIPELVRDGVNGFLVPPRDVTALAAALRRLAEEPDLRSRFGAAGRATVEAEFDLAVNARRLIERFGTATEGSSAAAAIGVGGRTLEPADGLPR